MDEPASAPPLVHIDHVTKSFGEKIAVREVSLAIPAGQICGLLGPNGAGKTTLFRLLMGILKLMPTIRRLQLLDAMGQYAEDYSRGMKKKLGLLLAMLHQPKLMILDEPTNGLDVESTHLFYELMREEAARGTTIVFSTHLMDHVSRLCTHAVVIDKGSVLAQGSLDDLRRDAESLEDAFLRIVRQ